MCGDIIGFEPLASFLNYYAPGHLTTCAHNILQELNEELKETLDQLNEFFKAGLRIRDESPSDKDMNDRVKDVDLANDDLDVQAMIEVSDKFSREQGSGGSNSVEKMLHNLAGSLKNF